MTRGDKWKKRLCVLNYWKFKDQILYQSKEFQLANSFTVLFCIQFPKSYSKKKKKELFLKPHQEKPDIDNIEKAITDSYLKEDKEIYKVYKKKVWHYEGQIVIINHYRARLFLSSSDKLPYQFISSS